MNLDEFKALGLGTLYAIAAVFGMVGGCAAGVHYITQHHLTRWAFVFAYAIIGTVSGVAFYAASHVFNAFVATNIHQHVLYSIMSGGAVSFALFSANTTVKFIFKRLGLEVQITTRKDQEERREEK